MMQWTAPHQRQRNVPIRDRYGHPESITLAFAERQVLAISCRQRMPSVTTVVTPTSDIE
jgi:hypothetical protein